jgi:hypothetical protein
MAGARRPGAPAAAVGSGPSTGPEVDPDRTRRRAAWHRLGAPEETRPDPAPDAAAVVPCVACADGQSAQARGPRRSPRLTPLPRRHRAALPRRGPPLPLRPAGDGVHLERPEPLLAGQLAPALEAVRAERPLVEGRPHSAARLAVVPAVREATGPGGQGHVGEGEVEPGPVVPQPELAEPRRVQQQPLSVRQRHELATHGRVAPAGVVLADLPDEQPLLPEQNVRERALPDAGRSDEGDGAPGPQEGPDGDDPLTADRARRHDGHPDRDLLELGLGHGDLDRIPGEVDLREHHHGAGPRLPRRREVALDAPRVELAVERRRHQDHVDVRGEDLERRPIVRRRTTPELRPATQDRVHGGRPLRGPGIHGHPVADDRQLGRPCLVTEPSGHVALQRRGAGRREHVPGAAVGRDHPGREVTGARGGRLPRRGPRVVPAEGRQRRGARRARHAAHAVSPGRRGRRKSVSRVRSAKPIAW